MKVLLLLADDSDVSVVLVLDLSKPEELWNTLEIFIQQVRDVLRSDSFGCIVIQPYAA
jgi:hypothetical protein